MALRTQTYLGPYIKIQGISYAEFSEEFLQMGDRLSFIHELSQDRNNLLIPNVDWRATRETLFDYPTEINISQNQREEEIELFETSFVRDIKQLKKTFGNENLTIQWGLLLWRQ